MRGTIGTRQLISCAPTIVREFGLKCYLRCLARSLRSPAQSTFLECIEPPEHEAPPRVAVIEVTQLEPRRTAVTSARAPRSRGASAHAPAGGA